MDQRAAAFRGFPDAMVRTDAEALAGLLAEDAVLNTPLSAEPVSGRAAVLRLLTVVGERAEITAGMMFITTEFRPHHRAAPVRGHTRGRS